MVMPRNLLPWGSSSTQSAAWRLASSSNLDVYEGKERMESKQYVGEPTGAGVTSESPALTLCCMQP
eukprot:6178767-Pleurochrysis_carterae.AAC.1